MKNRIFIVLFLLFLFGPQNIGVCGDEKRVSEKNGKESYQELYRLDSKDKSVTAIWFGENPKILTESPDTPLEFGVKELIFKFSEDNQKIKFNPHGDFYHNWSFEIFNEDGRNVVLLQSYYGPYHVIKSKNLRDYLTDKAPPFEVVKGQDPDAAGGVIHDTLRWISNDTFEFTASCCGDERIVRHKIGDRTTRSLWEDELSFYTLVTFVVTLFVIAGIGVTVIIKYFKRKKR